MPFDLVIWFRATERARQQLRHNLLAMRNALAITTFRDRVYRATFAVQAGIRKSTTLLAHAV
jgi:hypothetical protein